MDNDRLIPTHWCNILCDFPDLYQASMFDPAKKNKSSVPSGNRLPKQPLSLLKQSHNGTVAKIMDMIACDFL